MQKESWNKAKKCDKRTHTERDTHTTIQIVRSKSNIKWKYSLKKNLICHVNEKNLIRFVNLIEEYHWKRLYVCLCSLMQFFFIFFFIFMFCIFIHGSFALFISLTFLCYYFVLCIVFIRRGNSIVSASTRSPTTERMKTPSPPPLSTTIRSTTTTTTTELPISINDIDDLLQNVATTTRRGKTTIMRTKSTTTPAPNNDDLDFLRQVVSLM